MSSSAAARNAYLAKYTSGGGGSSSDYADTSTTKVKKKKASSSATASTSSTSTSIAKSLVKRNALTGEVGLRIIDEDVDWRSASNSNGGSEEHKMQIIDMRGKALKKSHDEDGDEERATRYVHVERSDGSGWSAVDNNANSAAASAKPSIDADGDVDMDSRPRRRTRHDSPSDNEDSNVRRRPTAAAALTSSPRRRHDSPDNSPPRRKRHDSPDNSPPRKRHDSPDNSPPRRPPAVSTASSSAIVAPATSSSSSVATRRPRHDSPDNSPPRHKRHDSPPPTTADSSPPRRRRHDSPPPSSPSTRKRRHDSPDSSPPRRKRHDSPEQPRKKVKVEEENNAASTSSSSTTAAASSSDPPRQSGLILAADFQARSVAAAEKARADLDRLAALDSNAGSSATVIRDKSGKKISYEDHVAALQKEQAPHVPQQMEWSRGLAQSRTHAQMQAELSAEASRSFGRTVDDVEMNSELAKKMYDGDDPVSRMIRERKQSEKKKEKEERWDVYKKKREKELKKVKKKLEEEKKKLKGERKKLIKQLKKQREEGVNTNGATTDIAAAAASSSSHSVEAAAALAEAELRDISTVDDLLSSRFASLSSRKAQYRTEKKEFAEQKKRMQETGHLQTTETLLIDPIHESEERPMYSGPSEPWKNRYNILPGYRWDGVVRGNGWEEKRVQYENQRRNKKLSQYKWGSSDM